MINLYLSGCLLFVLVQAFFAATEISFISSSLLRLRHRQENGDKRAEKVYNRMVLPEHFLATTLVGINLSLVLSSSILTLLLIHLGIHNSLLMILFFSPMVVIFGELIPKNIGRHFREDFSCRTVSIYIFFEKFLEPIVRVVEAVTRFLVKSFIGKVRRRSLFVTKEELGALVKEIESQGVIDIGEKKAIEEIFEFKTKKVENAYLDIKKAVVIPYDAAYKKLADTIKKSGFTRYPVAIANGDITGYINIFDIFYNQDQDWRVFIRPIPRVNIKDDLYVVFKAMLERKENIALVMSGDKICGTVTFQDLIKEIVSSIVKI